MGGLRWIAPADSTSTIQRRPPIGLICNVGEPRVAHQWLIGGSLVAHNQFCSSLGNSPILSFSLHSFCFILGLSSSSFFSWSFPCADSPWQSRCSASRDAPESKSSSPRGAPESKFSKITAPAGLRRATLQQITAPAPPQRANFLK